LDHRRLIISFWADVAAQNAENLAARFAPGAYVLWPNTGERFTAEEFITVNCRYPGGWNAAVERVAGAGDEMVSVARVWSKTDNVSFHAVSFFAFRDGKIASLEEYWGEDGTPPAWRQALHIGGPTP